MVETGPHRPPRHQAKAIQSAHRAEPPAVRRYSGESVGAPHRHIGVLWWM